ncbi:MAG: lipoate--protein ligase family protein [Chloroflexi bacterium]|nr:lipoate--protein ligase family protein [Chloroflexota bacterium]
MDLYNLGTVSWLDSQLIYHALPRLGREGLILLQPEAPYVCIGYHQNAHAEIDMETLESQNIPLFRREVGGGAVYLNQGQLFYQLVLRADRPDVPKNKGAFYRKYLAPVIAAFRELGVEAIFKPVNDITVDGRKISGNGAGEIEDHVILVGNMMLDFDYDMMSQVLRVPDEKFRDKVHKTLYEALTTLKRELDTVPPLQALAEMLAQHFAALLGPLTERQVDDELRAMAASLWERFQTEDWLFENDRRKAEREVKIAEDILVIERVYKSPGGLIRAYAIQREGHLHQVHLSGDFFLFPAHSVTELESYLEGIAADPATIEAAIAAFFDETGATAPGVSPEDLTKALMPE